MKHDGLEAIYFPGCYPLVDSTMLAACIYFSKVHFVTPVLTQESSAAYTQYLRQSYTKKITIEIIGKETDETEPMLRRMHGYWCFIKNFGPLLGEVIEYHPSLMTERAWSIAETICTKGLPINDYLAFVKMSQDEADEIVRQYQGKRILEDAFLCNILPTARSLSIQENYVPLSDDPSLPAPVPKDLRVSANDLAASLALKMLALSLPAPETMEPEDILEIREIMKDNLQAFRIMALRLTIELRDVLSSGANREQLESETDFLVKTKVMPHVEEIRRRTQIERGKFWRKVFGNTPKWLSLGLASFADPTGAAWSAAIREASKDMAGLLEDAHRISIAGDLGIAFLIQIEDR